jgi:uncharacterized protein
MRIFAIGDLHLSHAKPKPMSVFGEQWREHERKIAENWGALAGPDDLLIVAGDISWAMRLDEARPDLEYIARLPGRKIIIKGNHDYWWSSKKRVKEMAGPSIEVLQADSVVMDGVAIVGTRGWQCPGSESSADMMVEGAGQGYTEEDRKIYEREVGRLKLALDSLSGKQYERLIVVLHYPPVNSRHEPSGFTELIEAHGAEACIYGHLHGEAIKTAFNETQNGTRYQLVSADSVDFTPLQIF